MKKIAMTLALSGALAMPALVSAQTMPTTQTPNMTQTFSNRGQCQSTLVQLRNQLRSTAKQTAGTNPGQFNQTTKATTQICQAFTQNGKTMFRIVPQVPTTGQ